MAFPSHTINNWIQHALEAGRCLTCGRLFPEANGPVIYSKRTGELYRGVPTTVVEHCGDHY